MLRAKKGLKNTKRHIPRSAISLLGMKLKKALLKDLKRVVVKLSAVFVFLFQIRISHRSFKRLKIQSQILFLGLILPVKQLLA